MSMRLYHKNEEAASLGRRHWWLTAFRVGAFAQPKDLTMDAAITFPNEEMLFAFARSLEEQTDLPYCICDMQVRLSFDDCVSCRFSWWRRCFRRLVQWQNHMLCRLFLRVTRPFCSSLDRLLYLYYFLPAAVRHIFRDKKREKCARKSCRQCERKRR